MRSGAAWAVRETAREPWAADGSAEPSARSEADVLDELGDEIARLAAHLHAGTGRLLAPLAEFDRREGWVAGGHRSCAHWLSCRAGYDLRTARSHVRVARAQEVRDRGCRFPGCGLRFTDAHHLGHWADGGETRLDNLLLLCRHHHRLVHEEGRSVEWWGERAVFRDPRDRFHTDTGWKPPELPDDPVRSLVRENRLNGADPGPTDAGARWERERAIPDEVWFAATEATLGERSPP